MSKTINLKIDVTKIDKERLFKGSKGTYLDAVVFLNDEPDQYGNNGMIVQSVSKEERERGFRGEILGNCKVFGGNGSQPTPVSRSQPVPEVVADDIPF